LIVFDGYELYKQRAEEAREYLKSLDVSPESEQECKRTVATARKISDQLNQEKIRIKKTVLEPYTAFEEKVKEIIGIITEGENVARDKLKAIDDQRREEKKEAIRKIWEKRKGSFCSGHILPFETFIQEKHLNKTVPISEVEKEMVEFLNSTSFDITVLSGKPLGDEYIEEYGKCLNALKAMETVNRRHETMKANSREPYMVIRITGKADVILAKQLLKDVNYKIMEEM
jgi:DNA repair exonuclease SbcCD ATPase subunit